MGVVTKLLKFRSLSEWDNKPWEFTVGFTLTILILKYIDGSFVLKCTLRTERQREKTERIRIYCPSSNSNYSWEAFLRQSPLKHIHNYVLHVPRRNEWEIGFQGIGEKKNNSAMVPVFFLYPEKLPGSFFPSSTWRPGPIYLTSQSLTFLKCQKENRGQGRGGNPSNSISQVVVTMELNNSHKSSLIHVFLARSQKKVSREET